MFSAQRLRALARAEPIERGVLDDSHEPRAELRIPAELRKRLPYGNPDLLRDVIRVVRIAKVQPLPYLPEDHGPAAFLEARERAMVARLGAPPEVFVRIPANHWK